MASLDNIFSAIYREGCWPDIILIVFVIDAGGEDYVLSVMTLHFSGPGRHRRSTDVEYEQCFNISTLPDLIVEANETFTIQLSTDDQGVQFSPQSATVVIIDNDGKFYCVIMLKTLITALFLVIRVDVTPASLILDEGSLSEVCISTESPISRTVEVIATTQNGSALGK